MITRTAQAGIGGALRLRDALAKLEELTDTFGADDLALRAREAREPLDRGEIWVVVVGQFKRGKSTLLNALLQAPVLPAGMIPVTSVVTQIRWGPEPEVRIDFQDGASRIAPLAQLKDFVSEEGNRGNRRGVRRVEVTLPSPLLEGGLVLVDTPGIGSLDAGATDRAYAFLPRVDAALVVLSPDPPLGEAEGAYLRALLSHTPHLLFVLNKVDLFPEEAWREAIAFNREGLARIQGVPPEDVRVTPVSAARAMEGEESGIEELRERLVELARERGEAVSQDAALRRLRGVAAELRARLEVEERAIHLTDANLEDRLKRLGELRRELALRRDEIQPVVLDATRRLVDAATTSLRARAGEARGALSRAIEARIARERGLGNGALVRAVSEEQHGGVVEVFDGWWADHEAGIREQLREAMTRAARSVDATGSTLTDWVSTELGVALPTPPPPLDLVDSHHFYYRIQGLKPELTVDLLLLLLPRPLFRWRIRRRIPRMAGEDLELNVGRVRGDLLYRAQETVRAFFAELTRRTLAAEEGIQTALVRALKARAGAQKEGAGELDRIRAGRRRVEEILAHAENPDPSLTGGDDPDRPTDAGEPEG